MRGQSSVCMYVCVFVCVWTWTIFVIPSHCTQEVSHLLPWCISELRTVAHSAWDLACQTRGTLTHCLQITQIFLIWLVVSSGYYKCILRHWIFRIKVNLNALFLYGECFSLWEIITWKMQTAFTAYCYNSCFSLSHPYFCVISLQLAAINNTWQNWKCFKWTLWLFNALKLLGNNVNHHFVRFSFLYVSYLHYVLIMLSNHKLANRPLNVANNLHWSVNVDSPCAMDDFNRHK